MASAFSRLVTHCRVGWLVTLLRRPLKVAVLDPERENAALQEETVGTVLVLLVLPPSALLQLETGLAFGSSFWVCGFGSCAFRSCTPAASQMHLSASQPPAYSASACPVPTHAPHMPLMPINLHVVPINTSLPCPPSCLADLRAFESERQQYTASGAFPAARGSFPGLRRRPCPSELPEHLCRAATITAVGAPCA